MKIKIKVKRIPNAQGQKVELPRVLKKGDWIDLRAAKASSDFMTRSALIPLGIAVKLPAGYEAIVAPRSSSFKQFGITCPNSIGIIDNAYCGEHDQWHFPSMHHSDKRGWKFNDRICQFRIQLSQRATLWQKLRWLLSSGIEIVEVASLDDEDRGGIGSTGRE